MATIKLSFAVAILLAIFNYSASRKPIFVDYVAPGSGVVQSIRLEAQPGGYAMLSPSGDSWMQTGMVTTYEGEPERFSFLEPGLGPTIELKELIHDFGAVGDAGRKDVEFKAELDGQTATLRQVRSEGALMIVDPAEAAVFFIRTGE